MKVFLEKFLPGILSLIFGALIGYFVTSYKEKADNKMRFMDYKSDITSSLIRMPDSNLENEIKVYFKDRAIENLTSVDIALSNLSDRDYEDVPVNISLSLPQNDSLEIIRSNFEDVNKLQNGIEYKGEIVSKKNSKIFQFVVKTANRAITEPSYASFNSPLLKVSFLVIGNTEPKIDIRISKKGLSAREYDYNNYEPFYSNNPWFGLLFFLFLIVLGGFIIEGISRFIRHIRRHTIARELEEEKKELASKLSASFPDITKFTEIVEKLYEINDSTNPKNEG